LSRAVRIVIAAVCFVLLLALASWFYFWDGSVERRALAPGERVTVGGRVTFTVPEGWEGFYDRYADIPSWVPLGPERPGIPFREFLTLRGNRAIGGPDDELLAFTYYRDAPSGLAESPLVAKSDDVELHATGTIVVAVVSGGDRPIYLSSTSQGDAVASMRRMLRVLGADGIVLP